MITFAADGAAFIKAVRELNDAEPFRCRLISLCRSYPPHLPFVGYWLITDGGSCTGAVARCGADYILCLTEYCDTEEVSGFLQLSGAARVLCGGGTVLKGFAHADEGVILRTETPIRISGKKNIVTPSARDAYAVLNACGSRSFQIPAWEDFYVDVNHKLRHQTMRLCGCEQEGRLAAMAMTVAEEESSAVLGAVACHPAYRRKGCGSAVTAHLVNALLSEGKTVYLHRAQHENAAFYAALGFREAGGWREYYT